MFQRAIFRRMRIGGAGPRRQKRRNFSKARIGYRRGFSPVGSKARSLRPGQRTSRGFFAPKPGVCAAGTERAGASLRQSPELAPRAQNELAHSPPLRSIFRCGAVISRPAGFSPGRHRGRRGSRKASCRSRRNRPVVQRSRRCRCPPRRFFQGDGWSCGHRRQCGC